MVAAKRTEYLRGGGGGAAISARVQYVLAAFRSQVVHAILVQDLWQCCLYWMQLHPMIANDFVQGSELGNKGVIVDPATSGSMCYGNLGLGSRKKG